MRIHSDTLTLSSINRGLWDIDGAQAQVTEHGSRKRHHAFNVNLYSWHHATGRRHGNTGQYGSMRQDDPYALTWDEWGNFLAVIFKLDPNAVAGPYDGAEDFHWQTGDRYLNGPVVSHHHPQPG